VVYQHGSGFFNPLDASVFYKLKFGRYVISRRRSLEVLGKRTSFYPVSLLIERANDCILSFCKFVQFEPDQSIYERVKSDSFNRHKRVPSLQFVRFA